MYYVNKARGLTNITVNWVYPQITTQNDHSELSRTAKQFGLDEEKLKDHIIMNGKMVVLGKDLWSNLKNTDSWELKIGDLEKVRALANRYNKDAKGILNGLKNEKPMKCPIILVIDTKPYLMDGNTRLMLFKALGITPKVLLVKVSSDMTYTSKRDSEILKKS
jgi:hypothetical protein